MRQRFARFMMQRYGSDELNMLLCISAIVLLLISTIFGGTVGFILSFIASALTIWGLARMFSKNKNIRYRERMRYLQLKAKIKKPLRQLKTRFAQRKTHRFFKCPNCKTTVRVPKGRGKIKIICPKCKTDFIKKS